MKKPGRWKTSGAVRYTIAASLFVFFNFSNFDLVSNFFFFFFSVWMEFSQLRCKRGYQSRILSMLIAIDETWSDNFESSCMCDGSEINWMVWREFRIWQWLQTKWFEDWITIEPGRFYFIFLSPDGAQTYGCECKARWVHLRNPIRLESRAVSQLLVIKISFLQIENLKKLKNSR